MDKLTAKERLIMDILYAAPALAVTDVRDRLADGSSYSSVRASLNRLVDKRQVHIERLGAKHFYKPAHDQSVVSRQALNNLMATFFRGSPAATISAVLQFSDEEIDADELERIKILLDKAEAEKEAEKEAEGEKEEKEAKEEVKRG